MNFLKSRYLTYLLIGVVLASLPFLNQMGVIRSATVTTFGFIVFYAIAALGLNVLLGYSGLISLGTAGFMGLAAYLTTHFTGEWHLHFFASLLLSVLIPTVIGIVVGLVSLRLEGMYLAIATLAVAEVSRQIFIEIWSWSSLRPPAVLLLQGLALDRDGMYLFIVGLLVVLMMLTDNFIHSPVGRALLTMRASEAAAQAMGINLFKYKLMAFGIATAYAAISGVLYAHFIRAVDPSPWTLLLSLQILAVIVIGGFRTITGPIFGSFIVFGVPPLILNQLPVIGDIPGLAFIFNGALIIIVILFYPRGLVYMGQDLKKLIKRKEVKSQ
ncbi:MAG: branched-chain amino acid ABC transporter permease [Defluviitaleaceae bacterium]|nr:branched-chain amino acid ABC transporter permease [Defluviitaleaceae bacterium]